MAYPFSVEELVADASHETLMTIAAHIDGDNRAYYEQKVRYLGRDVRVTPGEAIAYALTLLQTPLTVHV